MKGRESGERDAGGRKMEGTNMRHTFVQQVGKGKR